MKILLMLCFMLATTIPAYAVNVSLSSTVQVMNAPAGSTLNVLCGTSPGVYTQTISIFMDQGNVQNIIVGSIIPQAGNWFCRANFSTIYGTGTNTSEFSLTVSAPVLQVPTFTVIP